MPVGIPWPDHIIDLLRKLWAEGNHSATDVAVALGAAGHRVTRNAVLGKLQRLGLLGSHPQGRARKAVIKAKKQATALWTFTREIDERVVALHGEGMKAGMIADALQQEFSEQMRHITYNGVKARLYQLGAYKKVVTKESKGYLGHRATPEEIALRKLGQLPNIIDENPRTPPIAWADAKTDQCHWPMSEDPRDMLVCGAPCVEGRPYCNHHTEIAHSAPRPRTGVAAAKPLPRNMAGKHTISRFRLS